MNTEKEINELKKRVVHLENTVQEIIDWSQRVFGPPQDNTGGQGEEATSDDLYEVVSFDVKKQPARIIGGDLWSHQPYAWKLKIKNTSDRKMTMSGSIICQDSDEFDLNEHPTGPFEIKAGSIATKSGIVTIHDQNKVAKIKEWTCKFHVY